MLLFLDLETTGFDNAVDNILEISAVRYDETKGEIVARFDRLLHLPSGVEVSPMIEGLTGISTQMCHENGISLEQAQEEFSRFIQDDDIITGHNIQFDTGFLNAYGFLDASTFRHDEIDTFILSVLVLGQGEESHSLEVLSEKYGISHKNAHRAMSDVLANLDFYLLLEKIYARNFSENFQKFLNTHAFTFPEKYFFDAVASKKELLTQQEIPEISPVVSPQISFDTTQELLFSENMSEKKSFFFTSFGARKYLKSILSAAQKNQKKITIFYPLKQKEEFYTVFSHLKPTFPELEFFAPRSQSVCPKKFQKFLSEDTFSYHESIVATKIFRGQEMGEELFVRFMGAEWGPARSVLGSAEEDLSEISLKFLPFPESLTQTHEDEVRVFFGGEELENQLLYMQEEKFYSKRLLEDFSGDTEVFSQIQKILSDAALALRAEKGENVYTVKVLWKEFSRLDAFEKMQSAFQNFLKKNGENFSSTEKDAVMAWTQFLQEPRENEIKVLELFPDNKMAIDTLNPFFEDTFQKICSANESTFFFGKSFPKSENSPVMSFPLQREFALLGDSLFVPSEVFCPSFTRDATPQEIANCLIAEWEKDDLRNIIVSLTSQKNISEVKEFLRLEAEKREIKIFTRDNGGRGKIKKMMQKSQKKMVIGNTKFLEGLDLKISDFSTLFVHKVQFDHPKQPLVQAQRRRFQNDFDEYSIPRAASRLARDVLQFSEKKSGESLRLFLGEGRIADENSFYARFQKVFPQEVVFKSWEES